MTPTTYLKNKDAHRNKTEYYFNQTGKSVYHFEGQYYSPSEFKQAFPVDAIEIGPENKFKVDNPDTTKKWMQV